VRCENNLKKRIGYIVGDSASEETVGGAVRGRGLGCDVRTRCNVIHKETQKKIQRSRKCKNVCDCNVIVLLSVNGGVVQRDGFKLRYLRMRRFEPCFTHFFVLVV
jgi:hypothetical protein